MAVYLAKIAEFRGFEVLRIRFALLLVSWIN